MVARFKLVTLLLALLCPGWVLAAYAQVTPPSGWSSVGTQGFYNAGAAANGSTYNARVLANVTANVGGRAVTMPASMRFAANAGQIAMAAIRINPVWWVAGGAVAAFMDAYGFELVAGVWKKWDEHEVTGTVTYFQGSYWNGSAYASGSGAAGSGPGWFTSRGAAAASIITAKNSLYDPDRSYTLHDCTTGSTSWSCRFDYTGMYLGSPYGGTDGYTGGTVGTATVTTLEPYQRTAVDGDFVHPGDPVPDELPEALPVPLPVEIPIINPSDDPTPVPQTERVPVGAPQVVPGTDPAEYRQPVVDIVPAPSTGEPWRVDLQPKFITGSDPTGMTDPETVDEGAPAGETPPESQTDCDKYPEASSCKPLGSAPAMPTIETVTVPLEITPVSGFGPSTATCPAPRTITVAGGLTLSMPFTLLCQFADGIRPIVVGLAWVGAILSFMGLARKES